MHNRAGRPGRRPDRIGMATDIHHEPWRYMAMTPARVCGIGSGDWDDGNLFRGAGPGVGRGCGSSMVLLAAGVGPHAEWLTVGELEILWWQVDVEFASWKKRCGNPLLKRAVHPGTCRRV